MKKTTGGKKKEFIIGWSWYSFDQWSSDTFYLMVWGLKHFIQIYIHFTWVTLQSFYASIAFAVYWEGRVRKETEDHNSKKKKSFCIILYKSKRNILKQPWIVGADLQPIYSTNVGCIFNKYNKSVTINQSVKFFLCWLKLLNQTLFSGKWLLCAATEFEFLRCVNLKSYLLLIDLQEGFRYYNMSSRCDLADTVVRPGGLH